MDFYVKIKCLKCGSFITVSTIEPHPVKKAIAIFSYNCLKCDYDLIKEVFIGKKTKCP